MSKPALNPRFTRHVDAMFAGDLTDLFAASEAVKTLREQHGFAVVAKIIDREIALIDDALDGAERPLEQAEYAFAHGRRAGIRAFLQAADALVARAEQRRVEQAKRHEGGAESSPER